jgi:hypothetical protein
MYGILKEVDSKIYNDEVNTRLIECVEKNIVKSETPQNYVSVLLLLERIVNYEINTIRHRRRINDQNKSIKPYISNKSGWWNKSITILSLATLLLIAAAATFFALATGASLVAKLSDIYGQIGTSIIALATPFAAACINQIVNTRKREQSRK